MNKQFTEENEQDAYILKYGTWEEVQEVLHRKARKQVEAYIAEWETWETVQ